MSLLAGIIDAETLKYTAQYQGAKGNVDKLKRKIMELTNMMSTTGKGEMMDLD